MKLLQLFGYTPLPVYDAPAVNTAYHSALSGPPHDLAGWGGHVNRGAWQERQAPLAASGQGFIFSGYDGAGQPVFRSFGSQPLSDPKINKGT